MRKQIPVVMLALALLSLVGCQTGGDTFTAFKDTWTVAHSAYQAHCERVVQGKVSAANEQRVDAAWNNFRTLFKASLQSAQMNWKAAAPTEVQASAKALLKTMEN